MEDKHIILYKELRQSALALGIYEFEFIVEEWGIMWYPWFIYFGEKRLKTTLTEINSDDFNVLLKQGLIEVVKEYQYEELPSDLDFLRVKYKML